MFFNVTLKVQEGLGMRLQPIPSVRYTWWSELILWTDRHTTVASFACSIISLSENAWSCYAERKGHMHQFVFL